MAKLIPPVASRYTTSPGELSLFDMIRDDPSTKDWIVLQSFDLCTHPTQLSGEVDFVCIVPGMGVLCAEVKAHRSVKRSADGFWHLGNNAPDRDGPFKQAAHARYSIQHLIEQVAPELKPIIYWSCVVFTNVDFDIQSSEWQPWQVVDRQAIRRLGPGRAFLGVLQSARKWLDTRPSANWYRANKQRPTQDDVVRISRTLRPYFDCLESPRARIERSETELKQFTEAQFVALDGMEENDRVVFQGPAGCGKSSLAIECARRSAVKGLRTLAVCYNSLFGRWLSRELSPHSEIVAGSFHSIILSFAGNPEPRKGNKFWNEDLPRMAIDKILSGDSEVKPFDQLVIDEAQDLLNPDFLDCLDIMVRGGLNGGRVQLFGDFENQQVSLFSQLTLGDLKTGRITDLAKYSLNINCRNRPRVGKAAKTLGRMRGEYSKYIREDNYVDPKFSYFSNDSRAADLLRNTIKTAHKLGYLPEEIIVLIPSNRAMSDLGVDLSQLPAAPYVLEGNIPIGAIAWFSTIRRFKGLEAKVIIVFGVDDLVSQEGADLFYTGCTRTTDVFYFVGRDVVQKQIFQRAEADASGQSEI